MLGHSLDDLAMLRSKIGGTTLGQVGWERDDGEIQPSSNPSHKRALQLGEARSWLECQKCGEGLAFCRPGHADW